MPRILYETRNICIKRDSKAREGACQGYILANEGKYGYKQSIKWRDGAKNAPIQYKSYKGREYDT